MMCMITMIRRISTMITGTTSLTTMTPKSISTTIRIKKQLIALQEKLLAVEHDRMNGRAGVTLNEFDAMLDKAINKS